MGKKRTPEAKQASIDALKKDREARKEALLQKVEENKKLLADAAKRRAEREASRTKSFSPIPPKKNIKARHLTSSNAKTAQPKPQPQPKTAKPADGAAKPPAKG